MPVTEALAESLAAAVNRSHDGAVRILCTHPGFSVASLGPLMHNACLLSGADAPATGEGSRPRERIVKALSDAGVPLDVPDAEGNR